MSYDGPDRRSVDHPAYDGPERRRDPDDHQLIRVVREEIKFHTESQNLFLNQKFSVLEEGQRNLKETQILMRGKQEEFQREIDGWKAGARWVNFAAITLAAMIAAGFKAWEWLEKHTK